MATRIEAVATARSEGSRFSSGALKLARRAAQTCLKRAGRDAQEIDLLLNAGVYREGNLCEPALAALIQEDIGAGLGDPPVGGRGTFSFDVNNGGCGVLTSVHLIDGMLSSGTANLGMVVTSDSDPDPGISRGFDFPWAGGALLLDSSAYGEGFVDFHFETFPRFEHVFESTVSWEANQGGRLPWQRSGRNVLEVREEERYPRHAIDCTEEALGKFMGQLGIKVEQMDLVVPSQFPLGFPLQLAERLAIRPERVARAREQFEGAHTAGPIAALEAAMEDGRFQKAQNTLFVTVGAGITVGLALYRR